MNHLTRIDFINALRLLARIEVQAENVNSFARALVPELGDYVASELTTLLDCDLFTGQCQVVSRHEFQRSAFHDDYSRRVRHEHAMAMPLFSDQRRLVSVVLNRHGLDFSERDRERLELVRPHLAFLYRHARKGVATPSGESALPGPVQASVLNPPGLTLREGEVMSWLACGKTDAEIAALLSISPRTVQKHLEHIYVKLGVETRTAAVMRASKSFAMTDSRKICDQ